MIPQIPMTKDRFPWAILVVVFLLQAVIGGAFTWVQHHDDISSAQEDMAANVQVLVTILHSNLQKSQYQEITPLLTNWIGLYGDKVARLDLTAGNGFVFFTHGQEDPGGHFTSRSVDIPYSYQGNAELTICWSLAAARHHTRQTLVILGLIQLITTVALIFLLRLATLRKHDSRTLAARARELDLAP